MGMRDLNEELRSLHNKNREEISKVIENVLKKHCISFDNPEYYKRINIVTETNGKRWFLDGNPIFWESNPIMNHEGNKITMSIEYKEL